MKIWVQTTRQKPGYSHMHTYNPISEQADTKGLLGLADKQPYLEWISMELIELGSLCMRVHNYKNTRGQILHHTIPTHKDTHTHHKSVCKKKLSVGMSWKNVISWSVHHANYTSILKFIFENFYYLLIKMKKYSDELIELLKLTSNNVSQKTGIRNHINETQTTHWLITS